MQQLYNNSNIVFSQIHKYKFHLNTFLNKFNTTLVFLKKLKTRKRGKYFNNVHQTFKNYIPYLVYVTNCVLQKAITLDVTFSFIEKKESKKLVKTLIF